MLNIRLRHLSQRLISGGLLVGSAALLAACGGDPDGGSSSSSSTSSTGGSSGSTSSTSSTGGSTSSTSSTGGSTSSTSSTGGSTSSTSSTSSTGSSSGTANRVHHDNPFAATSNWYVNEWWSENAIDSGGQAIADYNTGVWMDRIAAIEPYEGQVPNENFGLREHLDTALAQDADMFMFVVYDLPGRDCSAEASNGELDADQAGMDTYKTEYIGRIKNILADDAYAGLAIVAIIEVDSLPNLVTNDDVAKCQDVDNSSPFGYTEGIRYALTELSELENVHSYVDAAHSGWLGWEDDFADGAAFLADVIAGENHAGPTPAPGWDSINGFITNSANYTPLEEPYLPDAETVTGSEGFPVRSATFYDWNPVFGELEYTENWREAMISHGAPSSLGMLIDTGRNGWGGDARPTGESSAEEPTEIVEEARIDRRPHRGSWCNQSGGVGERPQADPQPWIDAYVWVKPQGESDGISDEDFEVDPNDLNKKYDQMCDPEGTNGYAEDAESTAGQDIGTGALPDAPHAGRWYDHGFRVLVENAYPPL